MSTPESSAGSSEAREDACRDYQSSLEDLTFNSKPHINMLTILAEENVPFAKDIVSLIEAQIAKAPASEKLPVMYLMDSIVKNVGREYLTAFTKNLVATFICVFEKVDENTRKSLFKLRSTWDDIFPLKKLYALDVRVNSLDPAWPIKPLPPNVNTSSIHVNPKFLNKSPEESTAPTSTVTSGASTPPAVPEIQKNMTQEQLIRQQLLAKQKQLLELQQKKLELELEQTKAQLAVSLSVQQGSSSVAPSVPAPSKQHMSPTPHMTGVKPPHQTAVQAEKSKPSPSPPLHDIKQVNRDPRLNRMSQHSSHGKDQSHRKEFPPNVTNQSDTKASKTTQAEKQSSTKQEKSKASEKTQKKELDPSEAKSKSPSPLKNKTPSNRDTKTLECESPKVSEISKRDPRLKRHLQDKSESKEDEVKEKRRNAEKKEKEEHKTSDHRPAGNRNKVINGAVQKQDTTAEESEKTGGKQGRSSNRKRSRSRSPKARSPSTHSPKRRERRSPKRRLRSLSPTTSTPKIGKTRQIGPKQSHVEETTQAARDERNSSKRNAKQEVRDPRRVKKAQEDRPQDPASQHSTKASPDPKENAENWQGSKSGKRWKSGWEESKNSQQSEEHQALGKSPHQRHRENWPAGKGILSPRAPKQQHRLSVDANLQIPKELTSASKRELLKKANERLTSGEITQDEFLMVAHQIRQLFQYQEGKHRCSVREEPRSPFNERFKRGRYEDPEKAPFPESTGSRFGGIEAKQRINALMEDRALFDGSPRQAAARVGVDGQAGPFVDGPAGGSGSRIDGPPGQAALRFEGPLVGANASQFDGPLAGAGGTGALRFDGPPGQLAGPLRFEGPPGQVGGGGPLRFEGPMGQIGGPLRFEGPAGQPVGGPRFEGPGVGLRFEGPRGHPSGGLRFEGPHGQPMGPRGQPGGGLRFEGPHGQPLGPHGQPGGGLRFEGPHLQPLGPHGQPGGSLRFEGPHGQPLGPHGPSGAGLRFEGPHGPSGAGLRLEGPHGPRLIDGPVHQGAGGLRFDGPLGRPGPRFDGCHGAGFDGQPGQLSLLQRFDGIHGQPGPRFERAPGQQAQTRFDTAIPQRFDGPHQPASRLDMPLGLQGARFDNVANHPASRLDMSPYGQGGPFVDHPGQSYNGPSHGMQFQRPDLFDGSPGPNFNGPSGPGAQNFPLRPAGHYFDEKSLQGPQYGSFNNMPVGSNQVSLMSAQQGPYGQGQQYLPNPGSFVQNTAGALPRSYPDNHLGQLDVNELFAKLLSTGILKLSKTDSTSAQVNETSSQPAAEEEDDDQNEDQNVPDLTNFVVEELRQRFDSVINRLYTGIQCYSCGMRFTTSQTDVYADHLDWHYRQNRTEKDVSRKITHRRWYYSLTDWIEFEEIADLEERAKSQFFEKAHEEVVLKTQEAAKEKAFQSVPAGPAGSVESCEICREQFEQYWDEEEEEWHLRDAIKVDEKIYHPSCYEDYQKTSSFDCAPSPCKTPEYPQNTMLDVVTQETEESHDSPEVKEEPDDTPPACAEESTPASTDIKTEPDESV
ncbi:PCF11 protein, partial [Rhinopomastus cyanomelas]|nr:PCF11 protein [Rhinopomastus cyanomelas]